MSEQALFLITIEKKEKTGKLNLGFLDLTNLPDELMELHWLTELGLSDNQISDLSFLQNLQNLNYLDLSFNEISDYSILQNLQNLKELNISSNQISDLSFLQNLQNLDSLDISFNEISDYSILQNLQNLKELNLRANKISDISFLQNLHNLKELDISFNQISDISFLRNLHNLKELDISDNQISDLSFLQNLQNLKELDISDNQISDLSFLQNLQNLNYLTLISNKISDILFLQNLQNLKELDISFNQISDISFLQNLHNLKVLDLGHNQISDISFLQNLQNLNALGLSGNQISDYSFLQNLQNLNSLGLSGNQISDISFLQNLQNLNYLNLRSNKISDIRPLLALIEKGIPVYWEDRGNGIVFEHNPLSSPPPEIIKQGNKAILDYFEELEKQGAVPIYEAKLLIIGAGGSGKTSLARRLIDENATMPEEEESTKGIDILHLDFKTKESKDFRINIWDFGGQEIYHSTHQFFLTKRSLYILLDDTRKDDKTVNDDTFNYWLQVVELLSENSPVLIVQNEKADRSKALDLKSMQGRFDNVKGSWATNIQSGRGLNKVRETIEYHIQQLPLVGEMLPKQWVEIRRILEKMAEEKDYISLEEYFRICADHKIPEEDRALSLSSYLHDLGTFLHFQQDMVLQDLFILRNTWATDAVYKVLDNEKIKSNGYFSQNDLTGIWHEARYRTKRPQLLALMEKFQLCFQLSEKTDPTWLAPQLLPVETPDYQWETSSNLIIRYKYVFMPKGLLSRFFVGMNRYVLEPKKAWRSGLFLHREKTDAFVRETYGSREIVIQVKGAHPKELMTLISEEFDEINKSYGEKLRVKKMIPCICSICREAPEPHFYDYENLKRRKEEGQMTAECNISFKDVSVLGLLDGVFTKVLKNERDLGEKPESGLKTIELFLASSRELKKERREIELWVGRENKQLKEKGIFLNLNIWEDFLDAMHRVRKQDAYNEAVLRSDIFISLFATKVGEFTEEEFNKAYGNFLKTEKPKYIYTYFKNMDINTSNMNIGELTILKQFEAWLDELGHFPNRFNSTDHLIRQLDNQLDKILDDLRLS